MPDQKELQSKVRAAQELLAGGSTTPEKLKSAATLLGGINPKLDEFLQECTRILSTIEKIQDGDVIQLSAESLPENTEEDKRRKRVLLIFIRRYKDLQNEVVRVQSEMLVHGAEGGSGSNVSFWGRILSAAKGPLGVITIIAIGIAAMSATSVDVTIKNNGCGTMYANSSIPISIPGLSLPTDPIPSGGSAQATIPPFSFNVDGTAPGALTLSSIGLNFSIQLANNVDDVTFNGTSLLGKKSAITLTRSGGNALVIHCGS